MGMVTAVFNQGVEGETGGSMDEIKIYDEGAGTEATYKIGDLKIDNLYQYLGQYLDVTYTVKNSKKTIKSISTDGLNKTVEVNADDIDTIDGSYLEYYKEGSSKTSKVTFASNMKIIYNGVGVSGVNETKSNRFSILTTVQSNLLTATTTADMTALMFQHTKHSLLEQANRHLKQLPINTLKTATF